MVKFISGFIIGYGLSFVIHLGGRLDYKENELKKKEEKYNSNYDVDDNNDINQINHRFR